MMDNAARMEWLHSLVQELESQGVELPMGDYAEVYDIIETVRETFYDPYEGCDPLA